VVLGSEPTKGKIFYDRRKAAANIRRLSVEYGLEVDPDAVIEDIPVGLRQRVEILKALERNAHVLILDEPTAVLTPQETEALFRIMRSLAAAGRSILFISHKLKEVREIADRVTVMRLGKVVGTTTPSESSEQELASMMVGRSVELTVKKGAAAPGDVVLKLSDLTVADERDLVAVDGVDLEVRAGEIVALAGVQGNGQTELVEAITGLRHTLRGSIVVAGNDLTHATPRRRGPRARGPAKGRTRAPNGGGGQPRSRHVRRAPLRRSGVAGSRRCEGQRGTPSAGVRYPRRLGRRSRLVSLGRQPAEGRARA
jgi:simple sugar transport system ATP-binding protein